MVLNEAKLAWRTPVGLIAQRKRHVPKPEAPATSKQLNELWAPPTVGENVATFQVAVVPPQPTCNAYGSETGRVYHQSEVEPLPSPCHGAKPDPLAAWTQTPSTELPDTHEIWPLTLRLVITAAFRGATGADCGAAAAERGAAGTPAATFAPGWVNGMLTGELFGPAAAPPTVTPGRDEADGTVFWLAAGVAERSRVPVPSAAAWAVFAAALGLCDTAAPTPTAPPAKITTATATAIT
jgi:hypothetical protein